MLTTTEKQKIEALIDLEMPKKIFEEMLHDKKVKDLAKIIIAESAGLRDVFSKKDNYRDLYIYFSDKYTNHTKGVKVFSTLLKEKVQTIEKMLELCDLRRLTMYQLLKKIEIL